MFLIALTSIVLFVNANATEFEERVLSEQITYVNFDNLSYVLDAEAKAKLDKLDTSGDEVEGIYVGKTDSRGNDLFNYTLGLARAQAVSDYVDVENSTVTSVGKDEATEDDINDMRNDRVVLVKIITYKIIFNPIFGASGPLMGPTHHIQYNTIPQGMNRM